MVTLPTFENQLTEMLPRLRRFGRALARTRADADDLVQATLERALRSKVQWQPGTSLVSWVYRIMRNLWIDTIRARARRARHEVTVEEATGLCEDPSGSIEASVEARRIVGAMQRLPDEQREVVALILIEEFSYREAAEVLGLPIGTVSSRLVRGRNALLQMIGGE